MDQISRDRRATLLRHLRERRRTLPRPPSEPGGVENAAGADGATGADDVNSVGGANGANGTNGTGGVCGASGNPVPLKRTGTGPPLFCVHPAGGSIFCYAELARSPRLTCPVYGLQAEALEPGGRTYENVTAMAAAYVTAAERVHRGGGWRLAGWSTGGLLAYAMACRLAGAGHRVDAVAMLDPPIPGPEGDWATGGIAVLADFMEYLSDVTGIETVMTAGEIAALAPESRRAKVLARLGASGAFPAGMNRLERMLAVFTHSREIMARYRPEPFDGPVLLLAAAGEPAKARQAIALWRSLCGDRLRTVELPCRHAGLLRPPHLTTVTAELARLLDPEEGDSWRTS